MAIGNPINLTSNVEGKNISVIATAGQTQFTVTGGYRINQISVFRNGVRLVDGRDYTALDGSIVTLLSAATVADVLEFQVFDDFRVSDALNVNSGGTVNGNVTVTGILSTTNLSIGSSISLDATTGIITAVQVIAGNITGTAATATNAEGLIGTPDITINNLVGVGATFTGVVTYEDVTNVDSIGIVTARTGVDITANGLVVNAGVSTFAADLSIADKIVHTGDANTAIRFPSNDTFTVETSGTERLRVGSTGTVGVAGLSTATSFGGFNHLSAPFGGGTVTYTVTVASKTANHRYNGTGSSNGYLIDGVEAPFLTLTPGRTYRFTNDNTGSHPLKFYLEADKTTLYTTGVTFDNSYTEIVVSDSTPTILHYQCTNHGYMGNSVQVNSNIAGGLVGTPDIDVATLSSTGDVDIADKIVHTGDTNTAIRFPAVDTFTVETSGTEQFRIGSDGLLTGKGAQFNSNITPSSGNGIEIFASTSTLGFIQAFDRTNSSQNNLTIKGNSISLVGGSSEVIGISSGATASFAGDLSIADKIIHTGDTNTAIRFPSADTFTVETGGSEVARFDSNQRLLIGATSNTSVASESARLQVVGGTNDSSRVSIINNGNNGGGGGIQIAKARGAGGTIVQDDDEVGHIIFAAGDGTDFNSISAQISCEIDGTPGGNDVPGRLTFETTADGAASPTERLRIDSSGSVIIGDTDTDNANAIANDLVIGNTSSGKRSGITIVSADDGDGNIFFSDGTGTAELRGQIVYNHTGDRLSFYSAAAERLRIDSSGRALLGTTTSPTAGNGQYSYLVVQGYPNTPTGAGHISLQRGQTAFGADNQIGLINFGDSTGASYAGIECYADADSGSSDYPGRLVFSTTADAAPSPTERLRIDSIGTFHFKNGVMIENGIVDTTARNGTQAVNLDNGMVHYFTTSATDEWKPNFRGNSSNTLNSLMGTGDVCSPTMIVNKSSASHFANSVQVDGTDRTIEFAGGVPTEGGGNNTFDVYNYTIIKTGDDAFIVFASITNYE